MAVAAGQAALTGFKLRPSNTVPELMFHVLPDLVAVPGNLGIAALSHAAFGISGRILSLPAIALVVISGRVVPQDTLSSVALAPLSLNLVRDQTCTLPLPPLIAKELSQLTFI